LTRDLAPWDVAEVVSHRRGSHGRYPDLDDRLFENIDAESKAYLLGWIASHGSIRRGTIALHVHKRDRAMLQRLRDLLCASLPLTLKNANLIGFSIHSERMASDAGRWLAIAPGEKDPVASFPRLDNALGWAFLRGLFDAAGSISSVDAANRAATRRSGWPAPRCSIESKSKRLLDEIAAFSKVPAHRVGASLQWHGTNALDFLGKLYARATLSLTRKHDLYLDWCCWVPALAGPLNHGSHPVFRWVRTRSDAIEPGKTSTSDSGFDLTLLEPAHRAGPVTFYRTGIRVQPAFGWYFDVVPRSSIAKSGYMLANCVGVIDRGYTGEILVPLIKVDPAAAELALPARLVQMIPRQIIAAQLIEVDSFDETLRGSGGFGSSG
jgi:deoxyuridine 5'-triphosphate nucleotidohydrolase